MFLELEEKSNETPENVKTVDSNVLETRDLAILMKNVSAQWFNDGNSNEPKEASESVQITLREIDLEVPKGKLFGMYCHGSCNFG